ncbi:M48 family metallopeptidase [Limnobacter parvus]|uniref:M48 family metalloprotease n=1 Tax=Limnobacter parvus TaxID=2939690 RepID=A0ABT1XGK2_9BURK|nr:M48 family metalloprotease [Limnobacter parvus]MCR2746390.1 M48 family metalloprotease [Limnobacter parvus]
MRFQFRKSVASLLCSTLMLSSTLSPAVHADGLNNLPSLGDAGGAELSVQDERRLGALIMKDYRAFGAVNSDPEITSYISRLGNKIVQAASESPSNFEFFLVTDKSVNAFAMPGGYIGIHTGLIAASQTESELASVLAHEVGHVTQRHIARRFGQQKQSSLVATAAMIAALLVAGSNPQAASGLMAAGAGYSIDQQLSFSRDAEREADRVGFLTLQQAGFDTQGMVDFFGRLQTASRLYENNAPSYLRTHPLTTERIADIRNRAGLENRRTPSQKQADLEFELVRVKSIVFAERSNQQLADRLRTFESPNEQEGIKDPVALAYGKSLVLNAMGRKEEALKVSEQAIARFRSAQSVVKTTEVPMLLQSQRMRMTLDASLPLVSAPIDQRPPRERAALNSQEKALLEQLNELRNDFKSEMSVRLLYAEGLQRLGLFAESDSYLNELAQAYRSVPEVFDLLAQSALALRKPAEHHMALAQSFNARQAYLPAIEQAEIAKRFASDNYYLLAEIDAKQREYKRKADAEREFARFGN